MSKIYLLCISLFLAVAAALSADFITINPVPLTDQLPSNSIFRIYQDKEGLIWFGTLDGLCRYDAYRLHVFRSDVGYPERLTHNSITCLTEDGRGHLLVGTHKGVNILNKKTYQITPLKNEKINGQEIRAILTDAGGSIWIGTSNHIYRLRPDFSLHKQYDLSNLSVNSIYMDRNNKIWITTWRNGLYQYDATGDSLIRFPKIGNQDIPFKIFQDNRKQLWIGTWGDGLYRFNPDKEGDEMYIHQKIANRGTHLPEIAIFSMVQDNSKQYIWVMSLSGIHALEYTQDESIKDVDISYLFGESNNIFSEIIKDRKGNLWISAYDEGVFKINFEKPTVKSHSMPEIRKHTGYTANITTIYQDKDGILWLSQSRQGLLLYDPIKQTVHFPNTPLRIRCMSGFRSLPDVVWIGDQYEPVIHCYTRKQMRTEKIGQIRLTQYAADPGFPYLFYEDRKNNIWIVTSIGLMLKRFNKKEIEPVGFSFGSISGITEDTQGTVWISTRDNGIYRISSTGKFTTKNFNQETSALGSNHIETICADLTGKVWIASLEGEIFLFNTTEQQFQNFTKNLNIKGKVQNIVADDFGGIWFSTEKRMTEYHPENESLRTYNASDDVQILFKANAYYKNREGKLFFGGNRGIAEFSPANILQTEPQTIHTLISDVKINSKSIFENNNNQLMDLEKLSLNLAPKDKNLEIHFSSLNYSFPFKIQYAYKLEGVDKDWIYTEDNRNFAVYNQLKKGNYTFLVKATDENNLWSCETTRLRIYKHPEIYETNWAYSLYSLLFMLCAFVVYRIIRMRVIMKNNLHIAQIEKEKSEELSQTKLRYFTNISHDFMTPLTIISCLIDDAENSLKGNFKQSKTIRSNIDRLKRLLQQVIDFRKIEYGKMKLSVINGDIALFIKDICYISFLPLMEKKNIRFSFVSEPAQIPACFDADKIDKIIYNLLSNAHKYTPPEGEVNIELKQYKQDGHPYLSVKVSDTGIGIAKENLDDIFVRFYNNHNRQVAESNGIGLSLTKELLDLHQGSIRVVSEVNKGSVFTFIIPIDRESYNEPGTRNVESITLFERNAETSDEEERAGEPTEKTVVKDDTTILIVEDNENLRTIVHNILSQYHSVLIAGNGKEALEYVHENQINIIISDVMMPEMDGLELCRTLKHNVETSHIPIILLTACNSVDDRIACYDAGADAYISKPFELKVLEARINNFITNRQNKQREFKEDPGINISKLDYPGRDEQFLYKAVECIEKHLSEENFDIDTFAKILNLSKSSLYRKLKTMTNLSPIEFIRNIRLKHACEMLKDSAASISEVAYSVGFSDPRYFATCFKNEFHVSPTEFQRKLTEEVGI
ncbi:MAG: Sensor histidine kinase TodS [Candidatus Ordinivivax streblomastigis]|uniref:histidine kinase n=1 Tax=Candidatus Ordinivivax streblomastigis TaxID=2540710 RepID=A0A5M8P2Y7_9BACT|nr:MAG: Sensor histidine kinase TodS [Candidatus Ordinivivax streblomastigis]